MTESDFQGYTGKNYRKFQGRELQDIHGMGMELQDIHGMGITGITGHPWNELQDIHGMGITVISGHPQ